MSTWSEKRDAQMIADGWVKRPDGYWEKPKVKPLWKQVVELGESAAKSTPKKRIRQSTKPRLNKLETEWLKRLKTRYDKAEIKDQSMRFELATGLWYKPDFVVFKGWFGLIPTVPTCFEVKGPKAWRGGFENLKMAARAWPSFNWILVWKENGEWKEQQVLS